jgi:hypothetical protein
MSGFIVDNLTTSWENDSTGLWSLNISPASSFISEDGLGMAITAQKGSEGDPTPYARCLFDPLLDLSGAEELRFWFKSSRNGDGSKGKPFYLAFEVFTNSQDPALFWSRLLPVTMVETWEMQRLWLGDMPVGLRQAVGFLQLRSLDPTVAFSGSMDCIIAVTSEPLQDVEQAILDRLNNRFQVSSEGGIIDVPAIIDLPENPGQRTSPYILITPLSIKPNKEGSGEIVDNYTTEGAFFRPSPSMFQLEYIISIFSNERLQKARLFEGILSDFSKRPYLFVNCEQLRITPFFPSSEESAHLNPPGQTPLFYRLTIFIEVGKRQFRPLAVPFLKTALTSEIGTGEIIKI